MSFHFFFFAPGPYFQRFFIKYEEDRILLRGYPPIITIVVQIAILILTFMKCQKGEWSYLYFILMLLFAIFVILMCFFFRVTIEKSKKKMIINTIFERKVILFQSQCLEVLVRATKIRLLYNNHFLIEFPREKKYQALMEYLEEIDPNSDD